MTLADAVVIALWPPALIVGALCAGAAWWTRRRRDRPLQLTDEQRQRVIANRERELQEDRT